MSRYYRRRRRKTSSSGTLILVLILLWALGDWLITPKVVLWVGGPLVLILSIMFLRAVAKSRKQQKRLRALQMSDVDRMDGLVFERYVAKLLEAQGYSDIRMTERYDLGVDIIARKNGVAWGVQVKRYNGLVKASAVRQVVTALNRYGCQRAMVVTNATFSRPARILAESNACALVGRDELASWIVGLQGMV